MLHNVGFVSTGLYVCNPIVRHIYMQVYGRLGYKPCSYNIDPQRWLVECHFFPRPFSTRSLSLHLPPTPQRWLLVEIKYVGDCLPKFPQTNSQVLTNKRRFISRYKSRRLGFYHNTITTPPVYSGTFRSLIVLDTRVPREM